MSAPSATPAATSSVIFSSWARELDELADRGRPGERHLVDAGMADETHADVRGPWDDVHDAGREIRLATHLCEEERAQRCRRRRLQDDGVAGGKGGGDLPGQHE